MIALVLATQLWFGSYHAMQGTEDLTANRPPIGRDAFVTKAECVAAGKAGMADLLAGPPIKAAGVKWVFKCVKEPINLRNASELSAVHDMPNHNHEAPQ